MISASSANQRKTLAIPVPSHPPSQPLVKWCRSPLQCLSRFKRHASYNCHIRLKTVIMNPSAVAVLPDTRRIGTSSRDRTVCLWELTTKKVLKRLVGHPSDVFGLAVSRDGKLIASCDATGGIIPWDGETGVCLINRVEVGFTETQFAAQIGFTVGIRGFGTGGPTGVTSGEVRAQCDSGRVSQ